MAKPPLNPKEPMQRRIYVPGAKRAAVLLWGEDGLNEIAQALPDDTREEFFRVVQTDDWIAVRHIIRWMYAAHHGPAKLSIPKIREYIDRCFDFSSGVVLRSVLRMADPLALIPRIPDLFRQDQTGGNLSVTLDPPPPAGTPGRSATYRLADSPFTESPQTRAGFAETQRYALSLTRAKDVTETHALEKPGTLVFRIRWT